MKGLQHLCPSLTLAFMLHAVKEPPRRDPFAFMMLHVIDYLVENSTAQISVKPANKVK